MKQDGHASTHGNNQIVVPFQVKTHKPGYKDFRHFNIYMCIHSMCVMYARVSVCAPGFVKKSGQLQL